MKISCAKDLLSHAVQTVQKAVSSKNNNMILTGIYLSAVGNMLELQATDYELGISCKIEATIDEPGQILLSGKYFQELVRKLPGDFIEISSNAIEKTIQITSNFSQFNLLSLPADEFPVLKPMMSTDVVVVKDNILRDLIKKTVFACATDESRPVFTGGFLEIDELGIRMVATNTHRLALKRELSDSFTSHAKMIIPAKILSEIARLLSSEHPQDIAISWHKNQVAFSFENIYIISRLIEGQFPDYKKVVPPTFATRVKIKTDNFLDAVERVSLLAREGEYNVIRLSFKQELVMITSNNPDIGKACETVATTLEGTELNIAFNAKYVTDILKNITSTYLIFALNTPLSPAGVYPDEDDESYTYIITPVRTS